MQNDRSEHTQGQGQGAGADLAGQALAVDLGGTKALLGLFATDVGAAAPPRAMHVRRLACADFAGFEALLSAYLDTARTERAIGRIESACIGLAGPVDGDRARLTNLPWEIDAKRIAAMLAGARVRLVNDFAAAAAGIETLDGAALRAIQQAVPRPGAPRLVLGAGTGLGTALLIPCGSAWRVFPGEGGHAAFAPRDECELGFWRHVSKDAGRVSWEHVVSGPGIEAIYAYLRDPGSRVDASTPARDRVSAARISAVGLGQESAREPGRQPQSPAVDPGIASAALDMFASAFGAFAGDAALLTLPHGGIYIAGGIAAKVFDARRTQLFLQSFGAKGVQSALMSGFPVSLVAEPRVGLLGAALLATRRDRDQTSD
jgi:glucokinase